MTNRLTLDYGMRFVHQQPQYDQFDQESNFFPNSGTARKRAGALRSRVQQWRDGVFGQHPQRKESAHRGRLSPRRAPRTRRC